MKTRSKLNRRHSRVLAAATVSLVCGIIDRAGAGDCFAPPVLGDPRAPALQHIGQSVDIDGDVAVVGAPGDLFECTPPPGVVYVYRFSRNSWNLEAMLAPSDCADAAGFGWDVAVERDVIVVSASRGYQVGSPDDAGGVVFVFRRDTVTSNWTQEARLAQPSQPVDGFFGWAVSLSGNRIAIGAPTFPLEIPSYPQHGHVYVYKHDAASGEWQLETSLSADEFVKYGFGFDIFGHDVAIHNDRLIIASMQNTKVQIGGAAYVLEFNGSTWALQDSLPHDILGGTRFATAVAIEGDVAVVTASLDGTELDLSGAAYVFRRTNGLWGLEAKLLATDGDYYDQLGDSVALEGDTVVVGSKWDAYSTIMYAGSACVFQNDDRGWTQVRKYISPEPAELRNFGASVAISGNHVIVGEPDSGYAFPGKAMVFSLRPSYADCNANGLPDECEDDCDADGLPDACEIIANPDLDTNNNQILDDCETLPACVKTQIEKLLSPAPNPLDCFGSAVSIDGDAMLIGGGSLGPIITSQDAAFVLRWNGRSWLIEDELHVSGSLIGPNFGAATDIKGDWAIVGAPDLHPTGGVVAGAAFVFRRIEGRWVQDAMLMASIPVSYGHFGVSVGISGDRAVVGTGTTSQVAGAYVFHRTGSHWSQETTLDNPGSTLYPHPVAISGTRIVVGDPWRSRVLVYALNGSTWSLSQTLYATAGSGTYLYFGQSVAFDGQFIVVGAPGVDGAYPNTGAAYVYRLNGSQWILDDTLVASDPWLNDNFGSSVSVNAGRLVVGVPQDDDHGVHSGSAYLFERRDNQWFEVAKLIASDGHDRDQFGGSVAVSGDRVVVGALYNDQAGHNAGAIYTFDTNRCSDPVQADLNGDGVVNTLDLGILLSSWTIPPSTSCATPCPADINGDGIVNTLDLGILLASWTI